MQLKLHEAHGAFCTMKNAPEIVQTRTLWFYVSLLNLANVGR